MPINVDIWYNFVCMLSYSAFSHDSNKIYFLENFMETYLHNTCIWFRESINLEKVQGTDCVCC